MTVDARLLEILVCPDCHAPVVELEREGGIECSGCRRVYPIRDGIPVMLIEESTPPKGADGPS